MHLRPSCIQPTSYPPLFYLIDQSEWSLFEDSSSLDQWESRICLIYILCKSAPHLPLKNATENLPTILLSVNKIWRTFKWRYLLLVMLAYSRIRLFHNLIRQLRIFGVCIFFILHNVFEYLWTPPEDNKPHVTQKTKKQHTHRNDSLT